MEGTAFVVRLPEGRTLDQVASDLANVLGTGRLPVLRSGGRAADVPVSVLDTALIRRELAWAPTGRELRSQGNLPDFAGGGDAGGPARGRQAPRALKKPASPAWCMAASRA